MFNNSSDDIVFTAVKITGVMINSSNNYGKSDLGKGRVSTETLYFNTTNRDIVVVERNGVPFCVERTKQYSHTSKFVIRVIYTIETDGASGSSKCNEILNSIKNRVGIKSEEAKIIFETIVHSDHHSHADVRIGIDYSFSEHELIGAGGSFYIAACDKVVSLKNAELAPPHPFAIGTVSEEDYKTTLGKKHSGWGVGIGISYVNREPGAKPMYIKLMEQVQVLDASKGDGKPEGFYVTKLKKADHIRDRESMYLEPIFFSFEEATSLGIFANREDAENFGDVESARKHALQLFTNEYQTDKLKFQRESMENEKSIFDLEMMLKKSKDDFERFKIKNEMDKLEQDNVKRIAELEHEKLKREHELTMQLAKEKSEILKAQRETEFNKLKEESDAQRRLHEKLLADIAIAELKIKEENDNKRREFDALMRDKQLLEAENDRLHKLEMNNINLKSANVANNSKTSESYFKLVLAVLATIPFIWKFCQKEK
jgi:hypothetical protein